MLDFNALFQSIVNMSDKKEIELGYLNKDGNKILIELNLVSPAEEQLIKE